ncbi:Sex-regulated protein janus-A [Trichinella pseudospiralis]
MSLSSVEDVVIDEGTFNRCEYHDDILQEVSPEFINKGIQVKCVGGGRINHDPVKRTLDIYGYSVAFGKADHEKTLSILKKRFPDYKYTVSDEELKFKPRKHPGRFSSATVDLPDELHGIILNVLGSADSMKVIKLEATKLNNFLSMRKPPASEEEIRNKALKIFQTLHEQDRIKAEKSGNQWPPADESDADKELREKNLKERMLKNLKSLI